MAREENVSLDDLFISAWELLSEGYKHLYHAILLASGAFVIEDASSKQDHPSPEGEDAFENDTLETKGDKNGSVPNQCVQSVDADPFREQIEEKLGGKEWLFKYLRDIIATVYQNAEGKNTPRFTYIEKTTELYTQYMQELDNINKKPTSSLDSVEQTKEGIENDMQEADELKKELTAMFEQYSKPQTPYE
jgi:hypothetical protein